MTTSGKRLVIGYLTTDLSSSAGWGRYSRSLVEAVAQHADVVVLTSGVQKNETTVTRVHAVLPPAGFSPILQLKTFFAIIRHLRSCDVIHSLVEPYAPAAALAGLILRIPITMTLHGTYAIPPSRFSLKKLLMRFMYGRMKIVTTGSVHTEKKTRQRVPLGECRFIPNGVNLDRFKVLDSIHKKPLMLTVGMLKRRKGVDLALRAFAIVRERVSDAKYVIVGDNQHDGFVEQLDALVSELDVKDAVAFREKISDDELVRLYNEARVFVLLARSDEVSFEGFPMVYYEANACGTPVVTTGGFGSEYAIHDGENGYIVGQNDTQSAAERISRIMTDDALLGRMKERSLEEARSHTWDNIAGSLLQMYRDIIAI